jgi:hypothetical protein
MTPNQKLLRLEMSLKRKEQEAQLAREKGMHTTFGNRVAEISELKRQITKLSMGGR